MKIRIKGNSIRFRLTRTEVSKLCKEGMIEEKTIFQTGIFNYTVRTKEGITALQAEYTDHCIMLFLPIKESTTWYLNEVVGFKARMRIPNQEPLELLLEKDFVCLDAREEDQSDQYPNPKAIL